MDSPPRAWLARLRTQSHVGGVLVLAAVVWVQAQRADLAAETVSGAEGARPPREPLVARERAL